ncbi:hypothetical protein KY285_027872 [Solanum tuberosum]|nr:hypothetical protein KY285_027872 [Solanum tuberosum]
MPGRPPRNRRKSKDEPKKKYGKMSKQGVGVYTSQPASPVHNLLLVKVHKKVAILNQQAPTNLDQQDSTNLHQQYQAIMLLQQQFVVILVELRGVATGEDSARGGPKRPTNGGSSNVGFGIYTSASGTQILNQMGNKKKK